MIAFWRRSISIRRRKRNGANTHRFWCLYTRLDRLARRVAAACRIEAWASKARGTIPTHIRRRLLRPDDTRQEAAYLKALGEKQTPVTIKLMDGEVLRGWIEYYDRRMVRLTRDGAPNLFIFKHEIAYIAEDLAQQAAD